MHNPKLNLNLDILSREGTCQLLMTKMLIYEGRSINKLQKGAISLILEIGKIQNIRFVGNLTVTVLLR